MSAPSPSPVLAPCLWASLLVSAESGEQLGSAQLGSAQRAARLPHRRCHCAGWSGNSIHFPLRGALPAQGVLSVTGAPRAPAASRSRPAWGLRPRMHWDGASGELFVPGKIYSLAARPASSGRGGLPLAKQQVASPDFPGICHPLLLASIASSIWIVIRFSGTNGAENTVSLALKAYVKSTEVICALRVLYACE